MWAHYADSHNGVVIAFDMTKAGLNDGDKFVKLSLKSKHVFFSELV